MALFECYTSRDWFFLGHNFEKSECDNGIKSTSLVFAWKRTYIVKLLLWWQCWTVHPWNTLGTHSCLIARGPFINSLRAELFWWNIAIHFGFISFFSTDIANVVDIHSQRWQEYLHIYSQYHGSHWPHNARIQLLASAAMISTHFSQNYVYAPTVTVYHRYEKNAYYFIANICKCFPLDLNELALNKTSQEICIH